MAGGAGDDTYILNVGDGPTNAAGEREVIVDFTGDDTIRFGSGITLGTMSASLDPTGRYLFLDYGDDKLAVEDGAVGTVEHYVLADGQTLSAAELIGRTAAAALVGTALDGTRFAMGGTENDTIAIPQPGALISGGLGNDRIVAGGAGNTILYSAGDGTDYVATTANATGNGNVLRISGATAADLELGLDGLVIRVGADPNNAIHFESFNRNDVFGMRPFDHIELDDGSTLGYEELLARGFDLKGTNGDDQRWGLSGPRKSRRWRNGAEPKRSIDDPVWRIAA
jgi:hypothetical protein